MKKHNLEFVSYSGRWPNLCRGILILRLDGKELVFPKCCLSSGGSTNYKSENNKITTGPWSITKWPKDWPRHLNPRANKLVNGHIPMGCCGGCL